MSESKAKKRNVKKITVQTREEIGKLSLMNNAFMNLALEDNIPCVEEMLRVILSKPDLSVKTVRTQKMFQGFKRSIYLDVYAEDSKGVLYNIEIQQADEALAGDLHGHMLAVEHDAMLIIITVRRILKIPILIV